MATVKIVGLDKLQAKLKKNCSLNDVKTVVLKHGSQMQSKMVSQVPVDTSALKLSIQGSTQDGGLAYVAGAGMHYGPYVEFGTRKMDAQPYIRPAYNEQKGQFKSDLNKLMK